MVIVNGQLLLFIEDVTIKIDQKRYDVRTVPNLITFYILNKQQELFRLEFTMSKKRYLSFHTIQTVRIEILSPYPKK